MIAARRPPGPGPQGGAACSGDVVVGFDGSEPAADALRWAAREASRRGCPLAVVMALDPFNPPPTWSGREADLQVPPGEARRLLEREVRSALGGPPRGGTRLLVPADLAAPALVEAVTPGDLLVVGSRGSGGHGLFRLGSVSEQVVRHAGCQVVVVTADRPQEGGRFVVGVDGAEHGGPALRWAVDEARRWGAVVDAVATWSTADGRALGGRPGPSADQLEAQANELLEAAVRAACPDDAATVNRRVVEGRAGPVLVREAATANLLVVGRRGRGGYAGLELGSVSCHCLRHASCPTAVVRAPGVRSR